MRVQAMKSWGPATAIALVLTALASCGSGATPENNLACRHNDAPREIAGGTFMIGSDQTYSEEGPALEVAIGTFWLDATEVTVAQFRAFVEATGYVTVAERPVDPSTLDAHALSDAERAEMLSPGGAVFSPDAASSVQNLNWWTYTPGANWRRPRGPNSAAASEYEPATQIAYEDAAAYAAWVGGRLPTEAEWEVAATAGDRAFNAQRHAPVNANTWQGVFPIQNSATDGYVGVAPVGCYAPNANGLYDMLGNVWEWTSDVYQERHSGVAPAQEMHADRPAASGYGVIKGGSYLCAQNYCMRFRPAARQAQDTGLGTNHVGFRVAYDAPPARSAHAGQARE